MGDMHVIADEWDKIASRIACDQPKAVLRLLRIAFYAGAVAAHTQTVRAGQMPKDEGTKLILDVAVELRDHLEERGEFQ